MDKNREDLLQKIIPHMMSIIRHIRHPGPPPEHFLSPPQAHLFFTIAGKKEAGISVKELAESAHITPGAVTQFVDTLVERGMVTREIDPSDRRMVRLKLTPEARSHFEKMRKEHLETMIEVFETLSDDDLKTLISLLEKMDAHHENKDKFDA
jgi:DNA-binding MarR family transcriptional regulator